MLAMYAASPGLARSAARDEMLTIDPCPALDHVRNRGARQPHRRGEVDPQARFPARRRHLSDRTVRLVDRRAHRVVHEHGDAAEPLDGGGDELGTRRFVGQVGGVERGITPGPGDRGDCRRAAFRVAAGHDDARPFGRERRRDRLPDPRGGAGDERDLPLETHGRTVHRGSVVADGERPNCAGGARARRRASRDSPPDPPAARRRLRRARDRDARRRGGAAFAGRRRQAERPGHRAHQPRIYDATVYLDACGAVREHHGSRPRPLREGAVPAQSGAGQGWTTSIDFPVSPTTPDLDTGDHVVLSYEPRAEPGFQYQFADRQRRSVLLWLAVIFAVAVVALGRLRGLAALVGLAASIVVPADVRPARDPRRAQPGARRRLRGRAIRCTLRSISRTASIPGPPSHSSAPWRARAHRAARKHLHVTRADLGIRDRGGAPRKDRRARPRPERRRARRDGDRGSRRARRHDRHAGGGGLGAAVSQPGTPPPLPLPLGVADRPRPRRVDGQHPRPCLHGRGAFRSSSCSSNRDSRWARSRTARWSRPRS